MSQSIFRRIRKVSGRVVKITGIVIGSLVLLIVLLPELFPGYISKQIKKWANQEIAGELNFSGSRLSFIKHFPSLTLTLYDFSLKGSEPYKKDTLLAGKEMSLGFDLRSLFGDEVIINQFLVDRAIINVQIDSAGRANYNIYNSTDTTTDRNKASLQLSKIEINNSRFVYHDRSLPLLATADNFTYSGKANLAKGLFGLESHLFIESLDLFYKDEPYVLDKKIDASLITRINTNSLAFSFEKNDIQINELPLSLKGDFNFVKGGYEVDMQISSGHIGLKKIFSVLPPKYLRWYGNTEVRGDVVLSASVTGEYKATTNTNPDLVFGLQIKDGYINHKKAPSGVDHLQLSFEARVPGMDPANLEVKMDTLSFTLDKDYVKSSYQSKGINPVYVRSYTDAVMDVGRLSRVLGIDAFEIAGKTKSQIHVEGHFATSFDSSRHNTTITSLPVFDVQTECSDGYFKMAAVPYAFSDINLRLQSSCTAENKGLSPLQLNISPLTLTLAGKPFILNANLSNFDNIHYKINSKGTLDLEKIYAAFAQEGLGVKGFIETDLSLSGTQKDMDAERYDRLQNSGTLLMKNIAISLYPYPKPFLIERGLLRFKQDKIWLDNFNASYGRNQLLLNGYVKDVFNYRVNKGVLKGRLDLQSDRFTVDDFMNDLPVDTVSPQTASAESTGVVLLPKDISMEINADAKEVAYNEVNVKGFHGQLILEDGKLALKETSFHLADAVFNMQANYAPLTAQKAVFGIDIKADFFDVKKAYNELKLFRDLATAAAKTEGVISLNYHLEGKLDKDMMPVYPSLKGGGVLQLENVKVNGLKLFSAVSKATGKDSISNPDLKKVTIKTSIANNLITIERTKMKVFGFRPRIEGQTSFDGRLNLKFRLGLPPFGVFGIPMTVTGTSSQPIVKMRKGKEEDMLEETVDDEAAVE